MPLKVLFLLLFGVQPTQAMHVIIDPGHGGVDKGTTRGDFRESDVALKVAQRLAAKLRAKRTGFKATLTRNEDRSVGLLERVRIAEKAEGDVFLSIHVNSNPDPRAKGAEFYFQNQLAADEESMYLAHQENVSGETEPQSAVLPVLKDVSAPVRAILEDLLKADWIQQSSYLSRSLKTHWRCSHKSNAKSIHQAPFVVVSEVHMPAALVELGFVTNAEDFKSLTDDAYLEQVAQSLYEGLVDYKDLVDKGFAKPLNSPTISSN